MPCRVDDYEPDKELVAMHAGFRNARTHETYLALKQKEHELNIEIKQLKKDINWLESLLCSTCRVLSRLEYDFDENPRLSEWWHKHQEEDKNK